MKGSKMITYQIQIRNSNSKWTTKYKDMNKSQAGIYWQGQCAHNGWVARLLRGKKVIAHKGELS